MSDPKLKTFLESLTDDQVFAILEAARIALGTNVDIASEVGFNLSMSEPDINHIQHKIHRFMERKEN